MPDALIVDLDGVLRRWEPLTSVERAAGLPEGAILDAALHEDLVVPAITGQMTDGEWRGAVARELQRRHDLDCAEAVRRWAGPCGLVDYEVLALTDRARHRVPVALLTNATTRLDEDLGRLGLHAHLDHVFNSAEMGVAKPDRAVFALVSQRMGLSPQQCLFVDDTSGHVAAAAEAGMTAHRFVDSAGLREFLDRHL